MREKIKQKLVEVFSEFEEILGFFEGGSAAFDRADEWSDLDLQLVVKDDFAEQAVPLLEDTLESIAPIEDRFILPKPTWHGHWQGFYRLENLSPYLIIDFLIMKESSPSYFTETELHGIPKIFFDKTGRIGKEHINQQELEQVIPKRIKRIEGISKMFNNIVDKEIKRNRIIDAIDLYYTLILRSYIELLRIKHDPARWSFGCRYLGFDLPADIYNKIQNLFYIKNAEDLQQKNDKVMKQINKMLRENLTYNLCKQMEEPS